MMILTQVQVTEIHARSPELGIIVDFTSNRVWMVSILPFDSSTLISFLGPLGPFWRHQIQLISSHVHLSQLSHFLLRFGYLFINTLQFIFLAWLVGTTKLATDKKFSSWQLRIVQAFWSRLVVPAVFQSSKQHNIFEMEMRLVCYFLFIVLYPYFPRYEWYD